MRITTELRTARLTEAERKEKEDEQKKLQKAIHTAENKGKRMLPPDFSDRLMEEAGNLDGSVDFCTGTFQADSVIAKLVLDGEVDIIIANDADFSFLCGSYCLQATEFKAKNGDSMTDVTVKSGCLATITAVADASEDLEAKSIVDAKYPFIDGVDDPRYRLAVGLALGCDVLVGGITDLGPSKVEKIIEKAKAVAAKASAPLTADNLLKAFSERKECDLSLQELRVLLDAWYFEPAGVTSSGEKQYVFTAPTAPLDTYCAQFADDSSDGVDLIHCHGHVSQPAHQYFKKLSVQCSECKALCCGFCCVDFMPSKRRKKTELGLFAMQRQRNSD